MRSTTLSRDNDYRFEPEPAPAILDRHIWNAVMVDLSDRMRAVEVKGTELDDLIADLSFNGQTRIDAAITPLIEQVRGEITEVQGLVERVIADSANAATEVAAEVDRRLAVLEGKLPEIEAAFARLLSGTLPLRNVQGAGILARGEGASKILDFTLGRKPRGVAITRPTGGSYSDANGVLRLAAANELRFDHDPLTGEPLGALVERESTNLWPRVVLGNGWVAGGNTPPTVANDVTYLGNKAVAITIPAGASGYAVCHARGNFTAAMQQDTAHTHSIHLAFSRALKAGERIQYYATGNNVAPPVIFDASNSAHLVNQWGRAVAAPVTPPVAFNLYPVVLPAMPLSEPLTVYVRLWQMEPRAFASSAILTELAAATRAADHVSLPLGEWFNPTEGSIVFDVTPATLDGYPTVVELRNPSRSSFVDVLLHPHLPGLMARSISPTHSIAATAPDANALAGRRMRGAIGFDGNGLSLSADGRAAVSIAGPLPSGLTQMMIGSGNTTFTGHVHSLAYFQRRLSNTELQAKSAP